MKFDILVWILYEHIFNDNKCLAFNVWGVSYKKMDLIATLCFVLKYQTVFSFRHLW